MVAREIGFVHADESHQRFESRSARRNWRASRLAIDTVRYFSAEDGKYIEVKATPVELDTENATQR